MDYVAWEGIEVEGRLFGLKTLFVSKLLPKNYRDYPHVYLRRNYLKTHNAFAAALLIAAGDQIVTLEVDKKTINKVPAYLFEKRNVHFMFCIDAPWYKKLRSHDSIRFDFEFQKVGTISAGQVLIATPQDYKDDKGVTNDQDN